MFPRKIPASAATSSIRIPSRIPSLFVISAIFSLLPGTAAPQDARQVAEPKIPASCAVLSAQLTATDNKLAEADESKSDAERIQSAINRCKPGMAVELRPTPEKFAFLAKIGRKPIPERNAFLSGPLELREGVTLLIDKGTTLYASRNPKDYETTRGLCGIIAPEEAGGCRPLISVPAKNAAVMGDGVIDGRGGVELQGFDYSWWQMAREAAPGAKRYNSMKLIAADHADGFILYRITLHNAPNVHVGVNATDGFTAWGVHILTPTLAGTDARNTDGIDPANSSNITVTKSWIQNQDDGVALKGGVTRMSVLDNHFYYGHGMSVGSDTTKGDSFLLVDGLTLDHTSSGIRIKSNPARGGPVHDLLYQNICMRDVQVPIAISPFYDNKTIDAFVDPNIPGDRIPDYKRIALRDVTDINPGEVLIAGKDAAHATEVALSNVNIVGIRPDQVHAQFANIAIGRRGANFLPGGTGVVVTQAAKPAAVAGQSLAASAVPNSPTPATAPYPCDGKFPPMQ